MNLLVVGAICIYGDQAADGCIAGYDSGAGQMLVREGRARRPVFGDLQEGHHCGQR